MTTKSKTNSKSKAEPKKPTVSLAREGHNLSSLLWQKIQANVTPEVREMLFVQHHLSQIWDKMAPNDFERIVHADVTHDNLVSEMGKAEHLLTGYSNDLPRYDYGGE